MWRRYRHNSFGISELLPIGCSTIVIIVLGNMTHGGDTNDGNDIGNSQLSVGQFIFLLTSTMSFGKAIVGIFKSSFTILEAYKHIKPVAYMLNAPTRRHELYRQA